MDKEIFISKIKVNQVRNISGFEINLSDTERKHLIITGNNGSGKTTFLLEVKQFLDNVFNGNYSLWGKQQKKLEYLKNLKPNSFNDEHNLTLQRTKNWFADFGGVELIFTQNYLIAEETRNGKFLIAFFEAKRKTNIQKTTGINKVNLRNRYEPAEKINNAFIQYIVNLKAERSFARDDSDNNAATWIDNWFSKFETRLKDIFEAPSLKLVFDRKNFNFIINIDGKEPFDLTQLSDGYSAILSVITELILRMEAIESGNYQIPGVVLIDEIETHLHVSLQKKILPFLIDFFPNLQFIVTTHSPFVLSSIENSVICDLQNKIITEDLSGYSYDALIESYFLSDKYSKLLQEKVNRYEVLAKNATTEDELDEYINLKRYLSSLPKYFSPELDVKLQQIELERLKNKGK